jgi:predicted permease
MLAEGFLISALATLLGLLLASIALDGFQLAMARLSQDKPTWWTFEIDYRVVAVAVLAALLSTLAAGLPAAWRASRPALDSLLRDGGRMGTGLAIGRIAWGLVVFEVALACLLLGLSALMTKAVLTATRSDIGVDTSGIMTARVGVTANIYREEEERARFWQELLRRIEAQPGIEAAALTNALPGHETYDGAVTVEGRDYGGDATKPRVTGTSVSPSFFETFRIAPTQGRVFDTRDHLGTPQVSVINETMARELFPNESPIGKRIKFELSSDRGWDTIIGVVPDVVMNEDGRFEANAFVSVLQRAPNFMSIAMRGEGDPRSLVAAARTALAQTNPDLALYWERTFKESRGVATAGIRIIGTVFAVFAGVALVLAAAGLFGVLAFHVGQRTREIGVRRALGADNRQILSLVMRASGLQIGLGILIGMALLPVMARGLGDILKDQSPFDPAIYTMVLVLMVTVAIAATLTPTRRALNVDPAAALRHE